MSPEGDTQKALILFERESAAKTACLLTDSIIEKSHITVEPYFTDFVSTAETEKEPEIEQEFKPKTNIMAEILAAGYVLQDNVIEKGLDFDKKFGVTTRVQQYLTLLKSNAEKLDAKYKFSDTVTTKAAELDSKYHVQERAKQAADTAQSNIQVALNHPVGQKVQDLATTVKAEVLAVHEEAKRIAAEKKAMRRGHGANVAEDAGQSSTA